MTEGSRVQRVVTAVLALACLASAIGVQVDRERRYPARQQVTESLLYIPSGEALKRIALSYDALLADVYWIRAVQHFGSTRLAKRAIKSYDLLYPLLDITTTLDPQFNIAYRFGAIFLSEAYPNGPGRPDLAVKLLQKGFAANPRRWEYLHDIGFVHYWWVRDFQLASEWFGKASEVPGAPEWLSGTAARTLAVGGDRQAARAMWQRIYDTSEIDYMRDNARFYLSQLQVMDDIEALNAALARVEALEGQRPTSWSALASRGWLRRVPPTDPNGLPYEIDLATGRARLSPGSEFHPLPADMPGSASQAPTAAPAQAGS